MKTKSKNQDIRNHTEPINTGMDSVEKLKAFFEENMHGAKSAHQAYRIANRLAKKASQLFDIPGKLVVEYHEDGPIPHSWDRDDYIPEEKYQIYEISFLEQRKEKCYKPFQKARTYTAECCVMVGIK